jgi:hypothetical protein
MRKCVSHELNQLHQCVLMSAFNALGVRHFDRRCFKFMPFR